jgi:hypothetical protein
VRRVDGPDTTAAAAAEDTLADDAATADALATVARRGASTALYALARQSAATAPAVQEVVRAHLAGRPISATPAGLVPMLCVLITLAEARGLPGPVAELLAPIAALLHAPDARVRYAAARVYAAIATVEPTVVLDYMQQYLLLLLEDGSSDVRRRGAAEALYRTPCPDASRV